MSAIENLEYEPGFEHRYTPTPFSGVPEDIGKRDQWISYAVQFMRVHIARFPRIRFTAEDIVVAMKAQREPLPEETRWIGLAIQRAKREGLITESMSYDPFSQKCFDTALTRAGHKTVVWAAA